MGFEKMFSLNGKNALIVGGSRGLGRGMAEALSEAGAQVILASRKEEECKKQQEKYRKKPAERLLDYEQISVGKTVLPSWWQRR